MVPLRVFVLLAWSVPSYRSAVLGLPFGWSNVLSVLIVFNVNIVGDNYACRRIQRIGQVVDGFQVCCAPWGRLSHFVDSFRPRGGISLLPGWYSSIIAVEGLSLQWEVRLFIEKLVRALEDIFSTFVNLLLVWLVRRWFRAQIFHLYPKLINRGLPHNIGDI